MFLFALFTLHVAGQFAHELPVDPTFEDGLGDDEGHADDGDCFVGHRQVDQEETLDPPHVLMLEEEVDDERVASQREDEDGNVEAEKDDGGRAADGGEVVVDEVHDHLECDLLAEVEDGFRRVTGGRHCDKDAGRLAAAAAAAAAADAGSVVTRDGRVGSDDVVRGRHVPRMHFKY